MSLRILIGEEDHLEDGRIGWRSGWEREVLVEGKCWNKRDGSVGTRRVGDFCHGHLLEGRSQRERGIRAIHRQIERPKLETLQCIVTLV